jgi:hypothetical protein
MSLQTLYQHIETLNSIEQKDLLDLYEILMLLHKEHGNKILQPNILELIENISPDLASLITLTQESAGLGNLPQIVSTLKNKDFPEIKTTESQHIGIKVTSNTGKKYERTLNKDILKLSQ